MRYRGRTQHASSGQTAGCLIRDHHAGLAVTGNTGKCMNVREMFLW
ncbi:hypothetical protein RRSWK_07196 [Rhodopirellula sp. SWK7]|nr:hypothetical protein RRSWK_07196 [Rhodopirellula sp. SWK7]